MIEGLKPYPEYKPAGLPWLDAVPKHWEFAPNRALMRDRRDRVGEDAPDYTLLSLTLRGVIARDMENPKGKFPAQFNTYKIVRPNDFVFCLFDIDETPRGVGLSGQRGMITGAYDVFSPTPRINPRFLYHYYLFVDEGKLMKPFYTGLRKTIQRGTFASLKAPLPPPDEQLAIVRFLDHVNRKIDGFIRAKRKLIALLNEQKQATIHRAVTRGLDPNAKLKPSGIPWLGEIPEHWEVRAVGQLFDLSRGRVISHEEIGKNPGHYPVYSSQTANDGVMGYLSSYMFDGDFLTWTTDGAKAGTVFVRSGRFNCTNVCGTLKSRCPLSLSFVRHALNRAASYYVRFDINPKLMSNVMARIRIPLPPRDQQLRIVEHVDGEVIRLDRIIARAEREIALMQEYRTRLTADIVTGKLDVREAAAKLPEVESLECDDATVSIHDETEQEDAEA